MHIEVIGFTDDNGYYMVNALKTKDRQGNAISDYFVSIYPPNYISQTQGPIMPSKSANFICTKEAANKISGMVSEISENTLIIVKVYKQGETGGYVKKSQVNSDGSFVVDGLKADVLYQLKFIVMENGNVLMSQWAGNEGIGGNDRLDARGYQTDKRVNFRFYGAE